MKEIGLAIFVLGCATLAYPMYADFIHFITLSTTQARLIGGGLIAFGTLWLALSPKS